MARSACVLTGFGAAMNGSDTFLAWSLGGKRRGGGGGLHYTPISFECAGRGKGVVLNIIVVLLEVVRPGDGGVKESLKTVNYRLACW